MRVKQMAIYIEEKCLDVKYGVCNGVDLEKVESFLSSEMPKILSVEEMYDIAISETDEGTLGMVIKLHNAIYGVSR